MIGVFLGYAPEQSLVEHGLGRLLAMLVRAMRESGTPVVLAMPKWSAPEVRKVLAEFDVDPGDVEWLTTRGEPVVLRMRRWLARRHRVQPSVLARVAAAVRRAARHGVRAIADQAVRILGSSSVTVFLLALAVAVAVPLGIAAVLAAYEPRLLTVIVLVVIAAAALRRRALRLLHRIAQKVRGLLGEAGRPLRQYKRQLLAQRLYARLRRFEMERLVRRVNERSDISAWLVPTLFWPEAASIRTAKAVVVPDLVMIESPVHFARHTAMETFDQLRATIDCADWLICYSEHVKQHHLVRRFGVDAARVSVIGHAPVDLRASFRTALYGTLPMTMAARRVLRAHIERDPRVLAQLRGVDLATAPFLFYASQVRPHKNLLALIRAYERVLRLHLIDVKLVLTGDLQAPEAAELAAYVREHRLQFDVISIPRVPAEVLSALFGLARAAVCPTLFEGGLPFTFTEALSVGTPVVMSRIPVVLEHIKDDALRQCMLFDPYDVDDMCDRMKWALDNREVLLARQLELYQALAQRTWSEVAKEYVAALQCAAQSAGATASAPVPIA
jgi:glycosyltransferase involved in cell wall biosynthesis